MSAAGELAQRLGARKSGDGWTARCPVPAHEDKSPSLSISEGDDGKVLWHCHAGCSQEDVLAALELKAPAPVKTRPTLIKTFEYRDADGKLLYVKKRWEPGLNGGRKSFIFEHGGLKGRGGEAVLYNAAALAEANTVYIVEGEAKADLLNAWGLTGTCLDNGADSPWRAEYTEVLAGKNIVILPDNDAPGQKYAQKIAAALHSKAAIIKIIDLPGLPEKGDIVDWARRDGNDRERFTELIAEAPEWTPGDTETPASADLPDEPSIMEAAQSLTPESPTEDISAIVEAATKTLGSVARQKVYDAIKKATGLPLYAIKGEAAQNFEDAEPDHLVLARKVIEKYGAENILCADGNIYQWTPEGVWTEAPDREVKGKVHDVVEDMADVTQNRVNGVFDILKTEIYRPRHAWNADADLINFKNGVLRIGRTGATLEPHNRDFYHNVQIPIEYNPDAPEPRHLHAFLKSVWPDDHESIGTLQEVVGYLLTSDTRQQKIPMIVGPKRSGKGTIYRLLRVLLGEYNIIGPTLSSLQNTFGLQPLIGRTLAVISDARLGSRAEQQIIVERLLSISGEDALSVPRKFLEDWTGKLNTRFLILTNELPRLADASGALASRFIIIKMNTSFFGREDHDLDNKLASELPSILNWAIEGLYRLRARGYFLQPSSAQEAIDELSDLGSPISAFIRDECTVHPGAEVVCKDLYDAWKQWGEGQGREHTTTLQVFCRDLKSSQPGIKTENRREAGSRARVYIGIGLAGGTRWNAVPAIVSPTPTDVCLEEIRAKPYIETSGEENRMDRVPPRTSLTDEDDEDDGILEVLT